MGSLLKIKTKHQNVALNNLSSFNVPEFLLFFHIMQVIFGNASYCHAVVTWAINLLPVVVLLHILGGLQESWGWSSPLNLPGMRVSFACLSFLMKMGHLHLPRFIAWACINLSKLHIHLYELNLDILILHQVILWVFVIASYLICINTKGSHLWCFIMLAIAQW